ncbi:MAG: aminoacyl-tRNA hydrolase [Alphaproteobacteria bacterium]|nr:aminoacyl-tRNA hydrolase [Alphaproteobacteria bacterium]
MSRPPAIRPEEIEERFVRASGPGGQNVNKISSAVELRFDVRRSPSLAPDIRARLERLAGNRLTKDGVLVIQADRFRHQERNRADARARLMALVRAASQPPVPRIATRPGRAAKARRLEAKTRRGRLKAQRRERPSAD